MLRKWAPELALAAFIAGNSYAMIATDFGQTIPFHLIWISLALVYGYRRWNPAGTTATLSAVCLLTAAGLFRDIRVDGLDPAELTEVPLMAAVFLTMVWHTSKRHAALAEVQRYAKEQDRLRERERDFLRDASHLLRTPITVARGFTELIRAATDERLHPDVDVVLHELDSVSRISSRLLLLTATNLSDLIDRAPLDVSDILVQAHRRWGPQTERRWNVQVAPSPVEGDAHLLESAVDALVENALKHTQPGGLLGLRCEIHRDSSGGAEVLLTVTDDGQGIRPEVIPTLFRRPDRPTARTVSGGTGLGLALVHAIATAHGGSVNVMSRPGEGAAFSLHLPLATVEKAAPARF